MLGEVCRRPADRGEIEAAVLLAGLAHGGRTVTLRQHHHRAAGGLEIGDEGIHAAGGGRPERARGIAFRRFRRSRVIDRMVLEIIGQPLAALQPLAQLRMRAVARHDHRPRQRQPRLDRMPAELHQNILHRLVEIDLHHLAAELRRVDLRQILRRIVLELFQIHAVAGDLAERLAVGRARHAEPDRQRSAVARQPDHAHVVAEIFAAELRADAERLRHLLDLPLHLAIAEGMAVLGAVLRQRVVIFAGGELDRLHGHLGGGAADDDGEMVGRARRGAERQHLLLEERQQPIARQDRRRRLEQKRFVGRAAALGDEQKLVGRVGVARAFGIKLDLRRHVGARVPLLEHRDRRELRIAQIALEIRIARALGERRLVVALGPDQPALLAHDDRGAGVLAHRQHAAGGDVGVLEKIVGDELVVVRRLRVLDDVLEARQMCRPQKMIDIGERRLRQRPQRLARHHQNLFAHHALDPHALGGDFAVGRLILAERKQRRVLIGRRRVGSEGGVHGRTCKCI